MHLIGLGHKKRTGKDECAKAIVATCQAHGIKGAVGSLSAPLMDAAHELFGYLGLQQAAVYDYEYELKDRPIPELVHKTPRDVWKLLGSLARDVEQDALIKQVVWKANKRGVQVLVIPNVRFPNEAIALQKLGGKLFRVERPSVPPDPQDPFDTALDSWQVWDGVLKNEGTLEEWRLQCAEHFSQFIK